MTESTDKKVRDPFAASRAAKAQKAEQTKIRLQQARAAKKIKRLGNAAEDVSKEPTVPDPHLPTSPDASKKLADLYKTWGHERQPGHDVIAAHLETNQTTERENTVERQRSTTPPVFSSVENHPNWVTEDASPKQPSSRSLSRHSSREQSVEENADHAAKLNEFYADWEHDHQPDYQYLPGYKDSGRDSSPDLSDTELRSVSGTEPLSPAAQASKSKRERSVEHSQEEPAMKKVRLDERGDRSRSPRGRV